MATNKNASFRYRVLNECFRDGSRRWTIERLIEHVSDELNEQFGIGKGISERQLKEDIHIMRSLPPRGFDAPIVCRDSAYFYNDSAYSIEKKSLNTEDIRSLTEAITLLKQFRGLPHFQEIEAIVTKIEGKTTTNDPDEAIISFEHTQLTRGYEHLESLFLAIRQEKALTVIYRAFQADADEVFTIHPYYLKEYRQRWYVFGLVAERDMIYNLALDRITDLKPAHTRYKLNHQFNPTDFFKDIVGVTRPVDVHVQDVLLRVDTITAPYIQTRPIHWSQTLVESQAQGVLFRYRIVPNYEFIAEVLRLGEAAEIVQPDHLRQIITEKITNQYFTYIKS